MLVSGTILVGSAARAEAEPARVVGCGAQISSDLKLANDVGPCVGDGLDVVASGITLDLNGHTITGSNATNRTTRAQIGVYLKGVSNVTVRGEATISKFDAGVSVEGGKGNTVERLNVSGNIAHVLLTSDGLNPAAPDYLDRLYGLPCDYGDGIIVDGSTGNTITGNTAKGNGPFSGISLVGASSGNVVSKNSSLDNLVSNLEPDGVTSGPCGPFGAGATGQGRANQDIGIRIEGPGATHNLVTKNDSSGNQLEGISVHGNICPGNPIGVPPTAPNDYNVIDKNTTNKNGFADTTDGISVLSQGPAGIVCVASNTTITKNTSTGNARDGIFIAGRGSHDNTIEKNTVDGNGRSGIYLSGPTAMRPPPNPRPATPGAINNTITGNEGHGNTSFDAFDGNLTPPCDNNHWTGNRFGTVNQTCIQ